MRICSNKISPIPKVLNDQTCDFPACACVFWSSITCSEFDSVPFAMQSTTDTDESVPVKNPRFHDSTENSSLLSIINFPHDCCGIWTVTTLITPGPVDRQPSTPRVSHPFRSARCLVYSDPAV